MKKLINSKYYYLIISFYLLFLFAVIIISVGTKNIKFFTNISNSMSPEINTGSLTMVSKFPEYIPGDIITYYAKIDGKEAIITHRVLWIGGNVYVTKGDANQGIDREVVMPRLIIGKVIFIIPYLGYFMAFVKKPLGVLVSIILPTAVIILIELYKLKLSIRKRVYA